ncbi:hypothetical protein BDR05DRAFT_1000315 [Suillus weaverae]|nr:hypothetical protein BDR05DRAFT_1000315 [Suillus weaverae]
MSHPNFMKLPPLFDILQRRSFLHMAHLFLWLKSQRSSQRVASSLTMQNSGKTAKSSPSPVPFNDAFSAPEELSKAQIKVVIVAFVEATKTVWA